MSEIDRVRDPHGNVWILKTRHGGFKVFSPQTGQSRVFKQRHKAIQALTRLAHGGQL